jgi:MFS family permease
VTQDPEPGQSVWSPLRQRSFALLWGGFLVSFLGDSIQLYAMSWLIVTELAPRSGLHLGIVTLAFAAPRILLAMVAGTATDRFDRRRVLLVTQVLALLQTAVFLALVVTGTITFAWVVGLTLGLGLVNTLNATARNALVPSLVPRPLLGKAIALQGMSINIVTILGPALAGVLTGLFGVAGCLAINLVTFVVALGTLLAMRVDAAPPRKPSRFIEDVREGLRFIRSRPILWAPVVLVYVLGFFGWPIVRLLPLYASSVLGATAAEFGLLAAAIGVGAIAASLLVTARARPERQIPVLLATASVFVLSVVALTSTSSLLTTAIALAAAGFGQTATRSAVSMVLQLETPDELRGRVLSLQLIDGAMVSLGAILFGAVCDRLALAMAPQSLAGVTDVAALPDAVISHALLVTLGIMATACVVVLAWLGPVILRAKPTVTPGDPREE